MIYSNKLVRFRFTNSIPRKLIFKNSINLTMSEDMKSISSIAKPKVKQILMVLPNKDFDVTETAVPWRIFTDAKVLIHFCTGHGLPGQCDPLLLTGVICGKLGAAPEAKKIYQEMIQSESFLNPTKYSDTDFMEYDAVILPGGHAKGMREYLEDPIIQSKLVPYISHKSKIVGAICHGTVVVARAIDPSTGKSLLHNRKSTCLPKYMERTAYFMTMTAWKVGRYFRTYDCYVQDEICSVMANPKQQFDSGPRNLCGNMDEKYAFVCEDDNYVSARWYGDAYLFARTILAKISNL